MSSVAPRISPDAAPKRSLPIDDVPPEERDNPILQYMRSLTPEQEASLDLLAEAAQLYGGDIERSLDDIKAGRHPLQRGGHALDAWERHEAELAAIRVKLRR
jgi:hypothetical protein